MYIEFENGKYKATFDFKWDLVNLLKSLNAKWNPKKKAWYLDDDIEGRLAVAVLLQKGFHKRFLHDLKQNEVLNARISPANSLPLYPYQAECVSAMGEAGSCLNRSRCGLGKTLMGLSFATGKTLVITPKSVVGKWLKECQRWLPDMPVVAVSAGKKRFKDYSQYNTGVFITSYDLARIDQDFYLSHEWDILILDEVHRLVNTKAMTYKAIRKIKANTRFGLSATALMNSATDIYGVFGQLRPGLFGNYKQFLYRYCVQDYFGSVVGYKNMEELADIVKPYWVEAINTDANHQLPEITEIEYPVDFSAEEAKLYTQIKSELLFEIDKLLLNKLESPVMLQNSLVKLGKLQELADYAGLIGELDKSAKFDALEELLEQILGDPEAKVVIFSRFSRVVEYLGLKFAHYNPLILTGGTKDRQELIEKFQNNISNRLFITTDAGGEGIDLYRANYLINIDSPFSVGKADQRIGRIHRNGQQKPCFIYHLLVNGTIDFGIRKKLKKKQLLSDTIFKSLTDIKEILND